MARAKHFQTHVLKVQNCGTQKQSALFRFSLVVLLLSCLLHSLSLGADDQHNYALEVTAGNSETTLRWNAHPEGYGYNVYRNDQYIATVRNTEYVDSDNLAKTYYVVAFSSEPTRFFAKSLTASASVEGIDTEAPEIPENLSHQFDGSTFTLTWNHSADNTGVAGYNVHQSGQYLTTVTGNSYSFTVAANANQTFRISAFDGFQNFSALSEPYVIEDLITQSGPIAPTGLNGTVTVQQGQNVAELHWNAAPAEQQIAGYNVYRDDQYLTTVSDPSFNDWGFFADSHSYYVIAFNRNTEFSQRSASIGLSSGSVATGHSSPTQVNGLYADQQNQGNNVALTLHWNHATDNDAIAGYNIYLNDRYLTSVASNTLDYTVSPGTYSWYIVAYDRDNNFSPPSDIVTTVASNSGSGTVDPVTPTSPLAPQNITGSISYSGGSGRIHVQWDSPQSALPIVSYNVYENNQYLTTVNGNSFQKTVGADEVNAYYVIAIDNSQGYSPRSDRVRLPDQGNQAPYFEGLADVTAYAGETISVLVKPFDSDSDVPGLQTGKLPEGMNFWDNRDGTRTIEWRVLEPQVGVHKISITAMDAENQDIRTTRILTITVLLPDDLSTIPNLAPAIDNIPEHVIRVGDTVVMHVKGTDPNGHVPHLTILNQPANSTFLPYYEDDAITELRWQTSDADRGVIDLWFQATDTRDPSLTYQRKATLEIKDPSYFVRSGSRLRNLADQYNLKIGYASLLGFFAKPDSDLYTSIASEEFNIVSSENSMKWGYTNPERGEYRWEGADALVRFASEHNLLLHGHTLVWYSALPQWVQNSPLWERESLMNGYIDTLLGRYPNVYVWDVVNEAFEEDGSYRNSVWFQAMGESYIDKAFNRARSRDADAKLIYNDYNISWSGPKSDAAFNLVKSMKERGVPIDGIGFQMHLDTSFDKFQSVRDTFNRFAALGLDIYITELDVSITGDGDEEKQAQIFAEVLAACLEHTQCKAYQIWGFTDRYSWLYDSQPLIFDRYYQPKPAYRALQNRLSNDNGYPWR